METAPQTTILDAATEPQATPLAAMHTPGPMEMLAAAVASRADVKVLEGLLALQERFDKANAAKAFAAGMARVQAKIPRVGKDKKNSHLGNKYATLDAILDACQPIWTAEEFHLSFSTASLPGNILRVTATLQHASGHAREHSLESVVDFTGAKGGKAAMTAVQAVGATVTYLRRYLTAMIFGIPTRDDADGNAPQAWAPDPAWNPAHAPPAAPVPPASPMPGGGDAGWPSGEPAPSMATEANDPAILDALEAEAGMAMDELAALSPARANAARAAYAATPTHPATRLDHLRKAIASERRKAAPAGGAH